MTQINELQIRMPGRNEEDANVLGKQVAERLAEAMPDHSVSKLIPEIKVQIQSSALDNGFPMAGRIAEQIIRQIKLATL